MNIYSWSKAMVYRWVQAEDLLDQRYTPRVPAPAGRLSLRNSL
jgi:hypothetical protein